MVMYDTVDHLEILLFCFRISQVPDDERNIIESRVNEDIYLNRGCCGKEILFITLTKIDTYLEVT